MNGAIAMMTIGSTKVLKQPVQNFYWGCIGVVRYVRDVGRMQGIVGWPWGIVPKLKDFVN